jgi:two-component system NtrC family sensor kinase
MKILVVDDSLLNLAFAEKYLKSFVEIAEIFLCHEPEKVKAIIDKNEIDILLLDVIMPKITGFDILNLLRSDEKYDDIPIIMFTSLTDNESFKKCFEFGASDYINKPIIPVEFNARIKAAIDIRTKSNRLKEMIIEALKQNQELKELNTKLTDTKFHLVQSEKMAAIGQLASGIAHEINNPMGFVSSNFEILTKYFKRISEYLLTVDEKLDELKADGNEQCKAKIEEINEKYKKLKLHVILAELDGILADSENGVHRVTEIVKTLRAFARTVQDDEKDTYSVLDILNQVILISRNEVKYVSEIILSVPEEIVVYCNKVQIGQVLINIIVNAAQAIKSQNRSEMGHISINADVDDEYICIHIADDGPGIPKENSDKIFEPFFTTKEVGQGTGLGLSISYDIISKKHNGFIEVDSKVGEGTVFTIKLPKLVQLKN